MSDQYVGLFMRGKKKSTGKDLAVVPEPEHALVKRSEAKPLIPVDAPRPPATHQPSGLPQIADYTVPPLSMDGVDRALLQRAEYNLRMAEIKAATYKLEKEAARDKVCAVGSGAPPEYRSAQEVNNGGD